MEYDAIMLYGRVECAHRFRKVMMLICLYDIN